MKKLIILACFFAISYLKADVSLRHLFEYDKNSSLECLEKASTEEMWDIFLQGQVKLFFEPESQWIGKQIWWQQARNVLDIGSGNGAYVAKLANQFHEKTFQGIEKLPLSVKQANDRYANERLNFQEGDAEVFNNQLLNTADVVLFRAILQYVKDPVKALELAWEYLTPDGYVLMIDSCDNAQKNSHPIATIQEALILIKESQQKRGQGNRNITFEIFQQLNEGTSSLNEFYDVVFSNLDTQRNILYECVRIDGEQNRKLFSNHSLLLLTLLQRTYQFQIDLGKAYDELQEYQMDEKAWVVPGIHILVLKKKAFPQGT